MVGIIIYILIIIIKNLGWENLSDLFKMWLVSYIYREVWFLKLILMFFILIL